MTDFEILEKAIGKAIDNGWIYIDWERKTDKLIHHENDIYLMVNYFQYPILIFSHEFAKAFWGEELIVVDEHYEAEIVEKNKKDKAPYSLHGDYIQSWKLKFPKWKVHLREMVIEKEPLKYLEKFL